jgi:hypothetical protein
VFNRWEYVVAGPPIGQIAVAEPLAMPGETVMSPESFMQVQGLIEVTPLVQLKDDKTRKAKIEPEHYTYMRVQSLLVDPILPGPIHHVRVQTRHVALLRRCARVFVGCNALSGADTSRLPSSPRCTLDTRSSPSCAKFLCSL